MSAVIRALAVSLVLAVVASPALGGQQGYTSPDITRDASTRLEPDARDGGVADVG